VLPLDPRKTERLNAELQGPAIERSDLAITRVVSSQTLPDGPAKVRGDFKYDGGGMGKGGTTCFSTARFASWWHHPTMTYHGPNACPCECDTR
jgi:hypothetical protein